MDTALSHTISGSALAVCGRSTRSHTRHLCLDRRHTRQPGGQSDMRSNTTTCAGNHSPSLRKCALMTS
jgi:hypothetical protein